MDSKRKDEESLGQKQLNETNEIVSDSNKQNVVSRRKFIKQIGTVIISLTLVDRTAYKVFSCPQCSSEGDQDNSCQDPGDNDAGCGNHNRDEGCNKGSCILFDTYNKDNNCGNTVGGEKDPDEACAASLGGGNHDEDGNCYRDPPGKDNGDEDGSCNKKVDEETDVDNSCGDCRVVLEI